MHGVAAVPLLLGWPDQVDLPTDLPKNDLGWDIHPAGFIDVLTEAGAYGLPVVVTENGIADDSGRNRPRYLAEHLAALAMAMRAGVRVTGYFHWSIIDNFEWLEGYCPRFGLYRVDYADPLRPRVPTPAADVLRQVIDAREVSDALLAMQPPYVAPRPCHPAGDGGP
jgi:beta-glucosidase